MCSPLIRALAMTSLGLLVLSPEAMAQGRSFTATNAWDINATDVADAADGDDPYDFDFYVLFDQSMESGSIQREYHCSNTYMDVNSETRAAARRPGDPQYDKNCPNEPGVVSARELDYSRLRRRVNMMARFGIYKDLEFHVFQPFVIEDTTSLSLAKPSDNLGARPLQGHCTDPSCSQSSVYREFPDGAPDPYNTFFIPGDSPTRGYGLDNPTLGIWWAPYNDERDEAVSTLRLGVDYTLNVMPYMTPGSKDPATGEDSTDRVAQGYDELRLSMAMSRHYSVMRPFLEFSYSISNLIENPDDGPFDSYDGYRNAYGMTLVEPGDRAAIRFGSEIIPWKDEASGRSFVLEFGGEFVYQFEGRDYSPLFSALGSSPCSDYQTQPNGEPGCQLTQLNATPELGRKDSEGITDIEQFGTIRGWLGFTVQAARTVRFQARAVVAHQTDHFLTYADAGKDNGIQQVGAGAQYNAGVIDPGTEEDNPVFDKHMDLSGGRFRMASHLDFGFVFAGAMTF